MTVTAPIFLLALLPIPLLALWLWHRGGADSPWRRLLPTSLWQQLPGSESRRRSPWPRTLLFLLIAIGTVLSLAGIAWDERELPNLKAGTTTMIVLDASRSMLSSDIEPSRLARAKFKIRDLFAAQPDWQYGLVAFAGDAFTIAPLTEDVDTIVNLMEAVQPDVMPAGGSRPDTGIRRARELLDQAGVQGGRILLLTDGGATDRAIQAAAASAARGYRVDVLAVGTSDGAPIATGEGRFLRDRQGELVLAPVTMEPARAIAAAGNGSAKRLQSNDTDLRALELLTDSADIGEASKDEDTGRTAWIERGPLLLACLLPLIAWCARRGVLVALMLALCLPVMAPQQAQAATLFERKDQRSWEALQDEAQALAELNVEAADIADKNPALAGALAYRRGAYADAARYLAEVNSADGHYNRGNALARLGRYEEAIEAYDAALAQAPDMEDAEYNKSLLQQQNEQDGGQGGEQGQQGDQNDQSSQSGKSDSESQESQSEQDSRGEQSQSGQSQDQQAQNGQPQNGQSEGSQTGEDEQGRQENQDQQAGETQTGRDIDEQQSPDNADTSPGSRQQQSEQDAEERQDGGAQPFETQEPDAQDREQTESALDQGETSPEQAAGEEPSPAEAQTAEARDGDQQAEANGRLSPAERKLQRLREDPSRLLRNKLRRDYRERQRQQTPPEEDW